MCSYNLNNNSWSCQNSELLNNRLKTELKFQGYVVSRKRERERELRSNRSGRGGKIRFVHVSDLSFFSFFSTCFFILFRCQTGALLTVVRNRKGEIETARMKKRRLLLRLALQVRSSLLTSPFLLVSRNFVTGVASVEAGLDVSSRSKVFTRGRRLTDSLLFHL